MMIYDLYITVIKKTLTGPLLRDNSQKQYITIYRFHFHLSNHIYNKTYTMMSSTRLYMRMYNVTIVL